jgi:hypothetical protein
VLYALQRFQNNLAFSMIYSFKPFAMEFDTFAIFSEFTSFSSQNSLDAISQSLFSMFYLY